MWRTALLILGWIVASLLLYGGLLGLELHWNFFDWLPRFDLAAAGLGCATLFALIAAWFLAQTRQNRVTQICSLVLCAALAGLAIYVLPAEPKTQGFFNRETPSPLWYRGGRFVVLCCPGMFWLGALIGRRKKTP